MNFEILFIYVLPFVENCFFFVYFDSVCFTVFALYRLDNRIMEALCSLNELGGSSKTTNASFKGIILISKTKFCLFCFYFI